MSPFLSAIDVYSHQGFKAVDVPNHYSEDRVVAGQFVFAVIDGATSMLKAEKNGMNPSAYTAQFLKNFLHANDQSDTRTAADLLREANDAFRTHLDTTWPEMRDAGKLGPSAAAAVVKMHDDATVSVANISDCSIVIESHDGLHTVSNWCERHAALDDALADLVFAEVAKGIPVADVRRQAHIEEKLINNRNLCNVEYGVFNGEKEMEKFLHGKTMKRDGMRHIMIFSDGMIWPEDATAAQGCITTAKTILRKGVRMCYEDIRTLHDNDPAFAQFRRLKHMDDCSAISLKIRE